MGDMDINTILRSGRHSKLKLYRKFYILVLQALFWMRYTS